MADIAQVEIRAAIDQFRTDMASAGKAFAEVMRQMGAANEPMRAATKATGEAHDSLLSKLREFKGEQVQQARMARFYAGELLSLVPAGESAKASIQGFLGILAEGAAGGLSFGLAFEAVKFAIEEFTKHQAEAKKQAADHLVTITALGEAFERYARAARGASDTENTFLDVTKKTRDELGQKQSKLREAEDELARLEAQRAKVLSDPNATVDVASLGMAASARANDQRAELLKRIAQLRNEIDIARALKQEADKAVAAASAPAAVKEAFKTDTEKAKKRADLEIENYARALEYEEEADREASKRADANLEADNRRRAEQRKRDLELDVAETKRAEDQKEADRVAAQKRGDAIIAAQAAAAQQHSRELLQVGQQLGSAFGEAFGGMIAGTKSVGQAFAQMGQAILKIILDIAIKSITASALKAGGEAASSQAGIPIVGPALAIGAMTAMIASVMALLGNLTSSRGGYEVPGNVSAALGVLHPDETVLPADLSTGLKAMIRGGGAEGRQVNVTYNIPALFGREAYRALKDNETDVMRFFREALEGGR